MRAWGFYASAHVVLALCGAGVVALAVLGWRSGGATGVLAWLGSFGALLAGYAVLAVIKVSRARDPSG